MSKRRKKQQKVLFRVKAAVCFILLVLFIFAIDRHIRPIIKNTLQMNAQLLSYNAINSAMVDELSQSTTTYSDLATVIKDEDSHIVSAITTNAVAINAVKANLTKRVEEKLKQQQNAEIQIPVGTLIGGDFLRGRGPSIPLKYNMTNHIVSDIKSVFTDAGINQTKHQIMLHLEVQIYIMIPGYPTGTTMSTDFCIAETIIVGAVPEAFTKINGDDSSVLSKYNDYKAQDSAIITKD